MKILVLLAHPDIENSQSNRALLRELEREQTLLCEHGRIVLQFPMYWYSTPPLLKKWQDDVLTCGWAYGDGGDVLKDKELIVATSIGGHPDVYRAGGRNQFSMSEILRPLQATANICGMKYRPAFVVGGHLNDEALAERAKGYVAYITSPELRGVL